MKHVAQQLQREMIHIINDYYQDRCAPFDGIKGSGYGYESGQFGFKEYCIIKALTKFDNNNNNDDPDEEDMDEEEDYSDDYSDKEEERKDDRNAKEL